MLYSMYICHFELPPHPPTPQRGWGNHDTVTPSYHRGTMTMGGGRGYPEPETYIYIHTSIHIYVRARAAIGIKLGNIVDIGQLVFFVAEPPSENMTVQWGHHRNCWTENKQ
jgi:hypothetical protein